MDPRSRKRMLPSMQNSLHAGHMLTCRKWVKGIAGKVRAEAAEVILDDAEAVDAATITLEQHTDARLLMPTGNGREQPYRHRLKHEWFRIPADHWIVTSDPGIIRVNVNAGSVLAQRGTALLVPCFPMVTKPCVTCSCCLNLLALIGCCVAQWRGSSSHRQRQVLILCAMHVLSAALYTSSCMPVLLLLCPVASCPDCQCCCVACCSAHSPSLPSTRVSG